MMSSLSRNRSGSWLRLLSRPLSQARPTPVEDAVYAHLSGPCRVLPGARLLLCVSGGVDSMTLLHAAAAVRAKGIYRTAPLSLEVIHFNHRLRPESEEEADFVRAAADGLGAPFHLRVWAGGALAHGMHAATRAWRREESLALAHSSSAAESGGGGGISSTNSSSNSSSGVICTAHQLEDQMETVAMKLLRGAHISRLNMMRPREQAFAKPLLAVPKERLAEYLRTRGLGWREDASNAKRDYQRNRVRLDLLPLLASLAGGEDALYRRLESLSSQSQQVRRWVEDEAGASKALTGDKGDGQSLQLGRDGQTYRFYKLPELVQGEMVYNFVFDSTGIKPDFGMVRRLLPLTRAADPTGGGGGGGGRDGDPEGAPKGNLIGKSITISKELEIKREKWALVIRKRFSRPR
jgi:tRNA(Ile)-lysidine synthetase-like protein